MTAAAEDRVPAVLAVVVVRDGAAWLRECLGSLTSQSHPRLAVMAVDDGSSDESRALLLRALGPDRVLALEEPHGLAGAFGQALAQPVAAQADYVLLVHDDAVLDPDVVARLVEAATMGGLADVGAVGAKIVDHDRPQLLLDVGRTADRFGHASSPLQPGEIDQGQFDRVLEVLCVSSCAMLIARTAWQRIGGFDERIDGDHAEMDFCWRVRVGGFRVLMTPLARVRHRAARPEGLRNRSRRRSGYEEDRSALASMLRNTSALRLLGLLPLAALLALVRLAYLAFGRRFEEAYDVMAAWGWNIAHLPGTLRLRFRTQRTRAVKDRALRRFMEPAGVRLPQWFQAAEEIWEEQIEIDLEDADLPERRRIHDRTASLARQHPVFLASLLAAVVAAVAFRSFVGPEHLAGGVLPAFPSTPGAFWAELVSGVRTTGLGGSLAASPGLAAMGGVSWLLFGSTAVAQKVFLVGGLALAVVLAYRAVVRLTGRPDASVLAAAAYGLSGVVLWALSQGRIGLLVALAVLPAVAERLETAFGSEGTGGRWRFVAGVGVSLAVGTAFFPGFVLAAGVFVLVGAVAGRFRLRGIGDVALSVLVALVLLLPFVPTLLAGGGAALGSGVGSVDAIALLRLAPGSGLGTWLPAFFLPLSALLSFALVGQELRGRAVRAMLAALGALVLAWLSSAGYLPRALSDSPAYVGAAAVAEAIVLGCGLASILSGLDREAFGFRQIGTAFLVAALTLGLGLQALVAMFGSWAVVAPDALPPAYAVIGDRAAGGGVLWLGDPRPAPFRAPGGDPAGETAVGDAAVRWSLVPEAGPSALDLGRPFVGPGPDALVAALDDVLSGTTVHGGSLLLPFGVRFLVATEGDLAQNVIELLDRQADLDRIPAEGLVIFRNARVLSQGAAVPDDSALEAVVFGPPGAAAQLRGSGGAALTPVAGGWKEPPDVRERDRLVLLQTEFDGAWRITGGARPSRAFGWSTAFSVHGGPVTVRYGAQLPRTIEIWLLAALWAVALWVTRKPVTR